MATVDFVHACNHAFLNDQRQPCVIGILTDLFAPAFPYHRASVTIAAQIQGTPGVESDLVFELSPDSGPFLRRVPLKFTPPAGSIGVFIAMQMVQIFFLKPGGYEARVLEGDRVIGLSRLRVIGSEQQPPQRLAGPVLTNSQD